MQRLYTEAGRRLSAVPWERYPRPQLQREDWLCLNGDWELSFCGRRQTIRVPFCPESLLSGVLTVPKIGYEMVYRRTLTATASACSCFRTWSITATTVISVTPCSRPCASRSIGIGGSTAIRPRGASFSRAWRRPRLLSNHPCIVLWTIFNEGWGQFEADAAYDRLRALDPSRFIDATSGWFHQKKSDVDSLHIYFDALHLGKKPHLPQLLSEFGGYVWKNQEHSFNTEKTYGYRKYETREALVAALRETYGKQLPPLVRAGLCGAVYTQVSDVEDETNGFLSFDRALCKVEPEELRDLMDALRRIVEEEA